MNAREEPSENPVGELIRRQRELAELSMRDDDDHAESEQHGEHAAIIAAISADPGLTARQRRALIEIYAAMTEATASRRKQRSS